MARRRAARPRYPDALDARVRAILVARLQGFRRIVDAAFAAPLRKLEAAEALASADRQDADDVKAADLIRVTDSIRKTWGRDAPDARPGLRRAGTEVDAHARDELARMVPTVARIRVTDAPPESKIVDEWTARAWKFVRDADAAAVDRVARAVRDTVGSGGSAETLRKELQVALGVAESRARLIGRDQTAKLNAAITQARQERLGVARYEWSTSGDDRVRESHAAKDGAVFAWSDPPVDTGHPGTDIQCRCVAIPVLDDLDAAAFGEDYAAARTTTTETTTGPDGVVRVTRPEDVVRLPPMARSSRVYDPGRRALWTARQERAAAKSADVAAPLTVPAGTPVLAQPDAVAAPKPSTTGPDAPIVSAVVGVIRAQTGIDGAASRTLLSALYGLQTDPRVAARLVARGLLQPDATAIGGYRITTSGIQTVERARAAVAMAAARGKA